MIARIVGHSSFIGSHLPYQQVADWEGKPIRHLVPSYETLSGIWWGEEGDVLINCIGRCGSPNVDQCESIKVETNESNTLLPIMLANLCNDQGIRFIHIGSGCIYNGTPDDSDRGWNETDSANPQSYYAKTKYATDLVIADLPNTTILRVRMPVSTLHHPRNFIDKVAKYKRVIDIPNSMTFLDDLARCIDWVITTDKRGIWNVVNPEPLSAADVMREYQRHSSAHKFEVMSGDELDAITKAKRSNCILDGSKLRAAGFEMTPSKQALEKCMKHYWTRELEEK
jgi:dTDP-4-dehydrorhamnose reductase